MGLAEGLVEAALRLGTPLVCGLVLEEEVPGSCVAQATPHAPAPAAIDAGGLPLLMLAAVAGQARRVGNGLYPSQLPPLPPGEQIGCHKCDPRSRFGLACCTLRLAQVLHQ